MKRLTDEEFGYIKNSKNYPRGASWRNCGGCPLALRKNPNYESCTEMVTGEHHGGTPCTSVRAEAIRLETIARVEAPAPPLHPIYGEKPNREDFKMRRLTDEGIRFLMSFTTLMDCKSCPLGKPSVNELGVFYCIYSAGNHGACKAVRLKAIEAEKLERSKEAPAPPLHPIYGEMAKEIIENETEPELEEIKKHFEPIFEFTLKCSVGDDLSRCLFSDESSRGGCSHRNKARACTSKKMHQHISELLLSIGGCSADLKRNEKDGK